MWVPPVPVRKAWLNLPFAIKFMKFTTQWQYGSLVAWVNFRFCDLKDELAWSVRDSDIARTCVCVCVFSGRWGEEKRAMKPRSRTICCTNISIPSLAISNAAVLSTAGPPECTSAYKESSYPWPSLPYYSCCMLSYVINRTGTRKTTSLFVYYFWTTDTRLRRLY